MKRSDSHIARFQRGQRAAMAGRVCPACERGNALTRHPDLTGPGEPAVHCRYCPYVRLRGQTVADAVAAAKRNTP